MDSSLVLFALGNLCGLARGLWDVEATGWRWGLAEQMTAPQLPTRAEVSVGVWPSSSRPPLEPKLLGGMRPVLARG